MADIQKNISIETSKDKKPEVSPKEILDNLVDLLLMSDFGEELLKEISEEKD